MFKLVVDTNTTPTSPTLYADLEKTQALPRVIELVQGFRGKVRVYFVGEHVPSETASLGLYVRPMNVKAKSFQTEGAAREIDESGNVYFDVNLEADTAALSVALAANENVVMRAGLVSTDSVDGLDTQIEWQINLAVSASSIGCGANPPVSPTAIERHNADETAHPYLLERIRALDIALETELSEVKSEVSALETELSELEETVTANKSELKTEISELAETVESNHSELKTELSEVNSEVDVIKSNYVTINTAQTITGEKTFSENNVHFLSNISIECSSALVFNQIPANIIHKLGGVNCYKTTIQDKSGTLALTCDVAGTASEIRSEISELETELSENYSELKTEISEVNSEVGVIKSNYVTTDTAQDIIGIKTFSTSPKVPTADSETNDTTAASTAFVNAALEAEATARENADNEITANIDWLKTAVDGDWKTYMLARAGMTGVQENIDTVNRAIKEYGEDNTAWLPNRLIECWGDLYAYELFAPYRFEPNFWVEFFKALADFEANPTVDIEWSVTQEDDGTYSSNCPHFYESPSAPLVNFHVKSGSGRVNYSYLVKDMKYPVYFPNATMLEASVFRGNVFNSPLIAPKASDCNYLFHGVAEYNTPILTNAKKLDGWFWASNVFNAKIKCDSAESMEYFFQTGGAPFNHPLHLPELYRGVFRNTKMSSVNVAKTLNSLKSNPSVPGRIDFTGTTGVEYTDTTETFTVADDDGTEYSVDNCPLFTNDDAESTLRKAYVLAIAKKGWTILI